MVGGIVYLMPLLRPLVGIGKGIGMPREPSPKTLTGEMYFEDVQGDDKKKRVL